MGTLLAGKVAVITGAGNGIGRAEAIAMAEQGAKVVVNDIGTAPEGAGTSRAPADTVVKTITDAGGTAIANYDSVATRSGAESIINSAIQAFGRIDILVNNAGVVRDPQNIADIGDNDWEIIMKTHLFGTFYTTRYACSFMRKQKSGKIINTSSHVGLGWKGFAAYCAAKEGIAGFTRTVARDMAEYGVCCNAIRPIAAWRGTKDMTPRLAINKPENIATMVLFLASGKADNVTGRIFEVWRGHVGIFQEPPAVEQILRKDESWKIEELLEKVPQTLTKNCVRDDFPKVLNLDM